jgi:hypothetical protein
MREGEMLRKRPCLHRRYGRTVCEGEAKREKKGKLSEGQNIRSLYGVGEGGQLIGIHQVASQDASGML